MFKAQKLKEFLSSPNGKKIIILILIVLAIVIISVLAIYNRYFSKNITDKSTTNDISIEVKKEKVEEKATSKLDGLEYSKNTANRHPIAIMIENHPDARPQIGLNKASIIYEAIAEGGITRFMTIYGPNEANKIGPVRSARTYYLDWALEYDSFYAHVGGNMDALDLIPKIGLKDLDQFKYGSKAYWREKEPKAIEHTMYSDVEKLRSIASDNGWDVANSDFDSLKFKSDLDLENRPDSQSATINFSSANYKVEWLYDRKTNNYKRKMADSDHKDRITGEQLTAKNIIIQEVKRIPTVTRINEDGWEMTTIGEGSATVIIDGKKIDATWKKTSRKDRTRFYNPTGEEIEFNAGVFWYEIIHSGITVTIE